MSITNKWEEEQYIGKGAYSEVYRVKLHGKYYALKKIFRSILKNPIHRENIEREIKIMESINHPKIVKLYQTINQDDQISLLLQYASGGSLYDTLKNYGKLPQRQVKKYVKDIVDALQYLHTRESPILHRDIKPENLLIDEEGNCKLADFGSANLLDGQRLSYVGTLGYMAPEVTECQPHGIPFDNWSLGVLIYELLTGKIPDEETNGQIPYPPFLSRSVEDVIKKLLIKDPEKRMILSELKQHIWFCQEEYAIKKKQAKENENVNKIEEMRKRVSNKLNQREKLQKLKVFSKIMSKEKSTMEENEQVNKQANEYIQLLKQREKLKQTILKNQKAIEKEEFRRRMERPYLLQEIDRVKCAIKEYQNDIAILKARPLKTESQCKHNIERLGARIDQLSEYVKKFPSRVKAELFSVIGFDPKVEVSPISQHLYKLKTQILASHRQGLIDLIASMKANNQIGEMVSFQNQFHMPTTIIQDRSFPKLPMQSSSNLLKKQKYL